MLFDYPETSFSKSWQLTLVVHFLFGKVCNPYLDYPMSHEVDFCIMSFVNELTKNTMKPNELFVYKSVHSVIAGLLGANSRGDITDHRAKDVYREKTNFREEKVVRILNMSYIFVSPRRNKRLCGSICDKRYKNTLAALSDFRNHSC